MNERTNERKKKKEYINTWTRLSIILSSTMKNERFKKEKRIQTKTKKPNQTPTNPIQTETKPKLKPKLKAKLKPKLKSQISKCEETFLNLRNFEWTKKRGKLKEVLIQNENENWKMKKWKKRKERKKVTKAKWKAKR